MFRRMTWRRLGFLAVLVLAAWPAAGDELGLPDEQPGGLAAAAPVMPADRLAVAAGSPWYAQPFVGFMVPAVSAVRRLPRGVPPDGVVSNTLDVVLTPGEYEPASFVLVAVADVQQLELKAGELAGAPGRIPAANVDVKLVKCWYQAGNAWYSPSSDPGRPVLVPELLLNDDRLVQVDEGTRRNALRIEGAGYVELGQTGTADKTAAFGTAGAPVKDAPTLQPVALRAGRAQQFWVTVRAPEQAAAGIYTGAIALTADGKPAGSIRLNVKVLPFTLPAPRPHYDLTRDYYAVLAQAAAPAADDPRRLAELRNMARHNVLYPTGPEPGSDAAVARELRLRKEAGLPCRPLWLAAPAQAQDMAALQARAGAGLKAAGHAEVYVMPAPVQGGLEAYIPLAEAVARAGGRVWLAGGEADQFRVLGAYQDAHVQPEPVAREQALLWHAVGNRILSAAPPAAGVENPEYWRRSHGVRLYKADYDGVCLSGYYEDEHAWNDFAGGRYRCRNLVYPTADGVVDTLAWEGLREGLDDVRYLTLLTQLATEAMGSKQDTVAAEGRKAMRWYEWLDAANSDLDAVRLETVAWILKLRLVLKREVGQ